VPPTTPHPSPARGGAAPGDPDRERRVSIVIPTLNEAAGIVSHLAALAPLREGGAEILVSDGGSDDRTADLARAGADQVLSGRPGRAAQMNAGARAARGDILLFLHADTGLPPDAIALVTAAIGTPQRVWGRFDVAIAGRSRWLPVVAAAMNLRSRLTGIATGDQAMFCTREAFERTGGFPEQALMEDIELSARLRRITRPACLPARVQTSGRRWERNGVIRTIALMWLLRLCYFLGASPDDLARLYR